MDVRALSSIGTNLSTIVDKLTTVVDHVSSAHDSSLIKECIDLANESKNRLQDAQDGEATSRSTAPQHKRHSSKISIISLSNSLNILESMTKNANLMYYNDINSTSHTLSTNTSNNNHKSPQEQEKSFNDSIATSSQSPSLSNDQSTTKLISTNPEIMTTHRKNGSKLLSHPSKALYNACHTNSIKDIEKLLTNGPQPKIRLSIGTKNICSIILGCENIELCGIKDIITIL